MSHDQGRPSLFAGMDEGHAQASDTQRVRILSTLASSRGVHRPPHQGPRNGRPLINGWTIALGMGLATLLASFVLIVQQQHPEASSPRPPATPPLEPTQAAAPLLEAAEMALEASAPAAGSQAMSALATPAPEAPQAPEPPVEPAAKVSQLAALAPPVQPAKSRQEANKPTKAQAAKRQDQDVELIEAVMNHSGKRQAAH